MALEHCYQWTVEGVIYSKKYTDIFDTNLWPYKPWIFEDDSALVHRSTFTQS